ncbi:MAG: trypsin-like peptidase domain-containing protein [bacterium]
MSDKRIEQTKEKYDNNKKKRRLSCITIGLTAWFLLAIGIVFGVLVFPYVKTWLGDHGFISQEEEDSTKSSRTIVSEENWVTDVVEEVKDGVVSIAVAEVGLNSDTGEIEDSVNIGTGFVIDSSGLIMTNQHVVSDLEAEYVVVTSGGDEYEVIEVSRDDLNDIAILSVNADDIKSLTLGDSDKLKVGQYVVAIGTPFGSYPGSVTTGIISGVGRSVTASSGGFWGSSRKYENVIQTDAAINPGNSGGPLLDADGNVIGINFATTSGADNISFAIPINNIKDKIAEYNEFGKFIKPYLGVEYQLISSTEAIFYNDVMPGALVTSVIKGSPAEDAGIERADIITKINGDSVASSFAAVIQEYEVGDEIELTIWRAGETLTLTATLETAD